MRHYKNNIAKTLIKICNVLYSQLKIIKHIIDFLYFIVQKGAVEMVMDTRVWCVHPALKFLNDNNS